MDNDLHLITDNPHPSYAFIPMSSRGRNIMERVLNGPTPEEREQYTKVRQQQEAKQQAALSVHINRHGDLTRLYADHRILTALLGHHSPHEHNDRLDAACHGCPIIWRDDDHFYNEWPRPTWSLINNLTT